MERIELARRAGPPSGSVPPGGETHARDVRELEKELRRKQKALAGTAMQSGQLAKGMCWLRGLAVALASLLTGCSSANSALRPQPVLSQSLQQCNQTDSTVSCCLKKFPGQHERCGAGVPVPSPQKPNRIPPPPKETPDEASPSVPTEEERERWTKDICEPGHVRCITAGGGGTPGRRRNESQCQACFDACRRYGFWPHKANGKRCPGS